MKTDCNRCNRGTQCGGDHRKKCKGFMPPYDTWKLAEMVLAHPTGLNAALSALPFKINIDRYIKGRG